MDAELKGIWHELAHDEPAWQGVEASAEARAEILLKLAAGSPAVALHALSPEPVALNAAHLGGAFRSREIGGRIFLMPQKYERMLDFFLRPAAGKTPPTNSQEAALEIMHAGRHLLLTGGPGTGKSYVLQQFLNEKSARNSAGRPLRVTIAAPTGKAAARYMQTQAGPGAIVECSTIHRLLGIGHERAQARHDARNPIGCDILIVDEISMIDLGLFAALVSALPPHVQLILAGDLNQLPAIEGMPIDATINLLAAEGLLAHTALTTVRRFSADKAAAYAAIAAAGIAAIDNQTSGIALKNMPRRELQPFLASYAVERFCNAEAHELRSALRAGFLSSTGATESVMAALRFLGRQVILTERREGFSGSVSLNEQLRRHVESSLDTKDRTLTPIVARQNNYRLNIFNGDTGLLFETNENLFAVFVTAEGEIRRISAFEFTGWETAFALTVHKSQGSEYQDVFVISSGVTPGDDHRLLYTAVTRSRESATVLRLI